MKRTFQQKEAIMSFVKLLNNAILEVPILEVKLEKSIKEQDWDEQEKEYLIQIVRQLKEPKLCRLQHRLNH